MMRRRNSLVLARSVWPSTRSPTKWRVSLKMRRIRTKRTTLRKPSTSLAALEERPLSPTSSEPEDADALHVGQRRVRLDLVLRFGVRQAAVADRLRLVDDGVERLVSLQAERGDGHQDEE
ncbi:hypothetical protein SKAU_G00044380 [Synaphobranchus kaupii]|uniref:Uncharacterized protein n=1 Tax=Synaphobranchus kaupii TaxID=118154 RepID=A0A9Q1G2L4_SYNKA|nr:hypothetical protein SKAU_G00044380 [Synaphobranchus kaupii]